jgi:hypothetical protein
MDFFKIIYRTGIYVYKTSSQISYKSGTIVTFTGTEREVTVCSPNRMPIGFTTHSLNYEEEEDPLVTYPELSIDDKIGISIAVGQGEYQTSNFERSTYKINNLLYCSPEGLVTNKKTLERQATVGIVNDISSGMIGFITCFTNLEYCKFQ